MPARIFYINDDGEIEYLDGKKTEPMKDLGPSETRKASFVTPHSPGLKLLFNLLRYLFGSGGYVAGFTRTWQCDWEVDMSPSGGPKRLGIYKKRSVALLAEELWLRQHLYHDLPSVLGSPTSCIKCGREVMELSIGGTDETIGPGEKLQYCPPCSGLRKELL